MSRFDEADAKLSASVSRLLDEPVKWRPQRVRTGGNYTGASADPDPTRPERRLGAIVTWRPTVSNVVQGQSQIAAGGSSVNSWAVVVDFDLAAFQDGPRPRKGDHLELEEEPDDSRHLEITRLGDDGSARLLCYCVVR